MTPARENVPARVTYWDSERGFGFCRSAQLTRDVFLHVRTLPAPLDRGRADLTGAVVVGTVTENARGPRFATVDAVTALPHEPLR